MQETKKSAWLQEVENDAVRITEKRFRDQEEERQYQIAKKADEAKASEPDSQKGNK